MALVLVILSILGLMLRQRLINSSKSSLASVIDSKARLQHIVSELLARANEADQDLSYLSSRIDAKYAMRLSVICSKLASLGDSLVDIESNIEARNIADARKKLSETVETAGILSGELQIIRAEIQQKK